MTDLVRTKLRWLVLALVAFAGGVIFAAELDWTPDTGAASLLQVAAPDAREIRPVAELSQAFTAIAEAVTPAVVTITTERAGGVAPDHPAIPPEFREMFPNLPRGRGGEPAPQFAGGTGFLVAEDGYIITNNHVVEGADQITVVLNDRRQFDARVVGRDPSTDVAVIKIEGSDFPMLRMGSSEAARVGEWVLAIGNPLQLGNTVTAGIVSARGRGNLDILRQNGSNYAIEDFIQTDAAINPGNSGGPLVNIRGEVIGVNTAIYSPTGFYSGYGFAIPMDLARRVTDDLIRFGQVKRPVLGVQIEEVSPEDAEVYGLARVTGVVVQGFSDNSPGERAGLVQGDVIVAVNGQVVEQVNRLQRMVVSQRPGDEVTLDVVRYGQRRQVRVRLGEAPRERVAAAAPREAPHSAGRLGITVQTITPSIAQRLGLAAVSGVIVSDVQPFGPAGRKGVRPNQRVLEADRTPIQNVEQLQRILASKQPNQILSLLVADEQGNRRLINIRVPR